MPVVGEFTENLDLFLPDQKSGYNVDHFNYNFEILDKFSGRMMYAGVVNAGIGRTTYLSINAKLWFNTDQNSIPLVNDGSDDRGSWKSNAGNYYIVGEDGGGAMFGTAFSPGDWLVSTGEGWVKVGNGGGGGAEYIAGDTRDKSGKVIKAGQTNIYVENGEIGFIENWEPKILPVR
jgi:hypothetical protein